ncbi:unnamed protein product, partial [Mesorhabditis spiculigera]
MEGKSDRSRPDEFKNSTVPPVPHAATDDVCPFCYLDAGTWSSHYDSNSDYDSGCDYYYYGCRDHDDGGM